LWVCRGQLAQGVKRCALRNGEIDWWELPPTDLVEQLAHTGDVAVISQYATAMGVLRFNHLHPPFDNAAVR